MKKITLLLVFVAINSFGQCWKELSAGAEFTVGIAQNGTLWAWGRNNSGQLGDGTFVDKWQNPTQIGTETTWTKIASGKLHTLAIKSDGTLWAWGNNAYGSLGTGNTNTSNIPIQVGTDNNWAQITASVFHSLAIKTDGTLWAWGPNYDNQLAGVPSGTSSPTQIGTDTDWAKVKTGLNFSLGLKTNGALYSWGTDNAGQLGNGGSVFTPTNISSPTAVPFLNTSFVDIACGTSSGYALKADGTLWSWGSNSFGNLGHGNYNNSYTSPAQVGTDTNWTKIAAGIDHLLAVKNNNSLWSCGRNHRGQLGNGSTTLSNTLVQINPGTSYINVYAGNNNGSDGISGFSLAVKSDGNLQSWGDNYYGQLGNGAKFNNYSVPQDISCPTTFILGLENNDIQKFALYPNPTSSILNIDNQNSNNFEVAVFDLVGKKVALFKNQKTVDISHLNNGMYLIKITDLENNIATSQKIVKK